LASWSRVTPGCTRAIRRAASTARIARRWRDVSITTARLVVWPARLVAAPRKVMGAPSRRHVRIAASTSSASSGQTTPSGAWR
jgi:hypothetical protein